MSAPRKTRTTTSTLATPATAGSAVPLSEKQLQQAVIDLARLLGFAVYHTHDSRRSVSGYPDLTLAKGRRLIFAELKTAKGRVKPLQQEWLDRLQRTGAEAYVWRPADWSFGAIERVLRGDDA